jgi:hypothetical protein
MNSVGKLEGSRHHIWSTPGPALYVPSNASSQASGAD